MEKIKLIRAFIVGLMSAIAVSSTINLNLPTWVLFMAWVSFFVFGKQPKQMALSFIQIVIGMAVGVLIVLKAKLLSGLIGNAGLPITVVITITVFMYLIPKLKPINTIPLYFMGMIIFFGTHPAMNFVEIGLILTTVVSGFSFAWTTYKLEGILIKNIEKN